MENETGAPSFLRSMWEGIKGNVKGMAVGGLLGIAAGAAIGAIVAAVASGIGPGILAGATEGAIALGSMFASIGAFSGTITGVVRSRESGKVPIEDAVRAVQVSMERGMAVGQMRAQAAADGKWQDRIAQARKTPGIDTGQRLHS
ncbi:MAG: hypothetical protein KGI29_05665 [Pseudomonadota bacterium]|nr:hypothetical protein [Pseudomonadota bacterium]MDE3038166.1 hypothetical protein [Pseudomonadota bacterium]